MSKQINYIEEITDRLKWDISIKSVYLFGSYAYGTPDKDSDIDLLVILNKNGFIENYDDRIDHRINIAKSLYEINKNIAIDILVYTPQEWEKLKQIGGSFHREIKNKAIKII
ncbi:MAG: nucleotidyltransferase domain-containing protein [Bacteroidales bacterium]|nr:nucleotidyltransferase domain-containing protein [Bacteroidales bacterium]